MAALGNYTTPWYQLNITQAQAQQQQQQLDQQALISMYNSAFSNTTTAISTGGSYTINGGSYTLYPGKIHYPEMKTPVETRSKEGSLLTNLEWLDKRINETRRASKLMS